MKKRNMMNGILILFVALVMVFSINFVIANEHEVFTANVCCEKTKVGAWCQNTLENNCETSSGLRKTPTSCEATSFCSPGCCFDSQEGVCMENTPQKVCNDASGTWTKGAECNIPQCDLGCCVLGNQASFVTLTRCKALTAQFGLETNFRTDIVDEATCIAIAGLGDEGACVYEVDFVNTCRYLSRAECNNVGSSSSNQTSDAEFFVDFLCSAEELGTNCGPSKKTTCVNGKDEVYFLDTCGNTANIYDSKKATDKAYWQKKIDKSQSCGANDGKSNAGSRSCGNCDYFGGSICAQGNADIGKFACQDLNCKNTENGNSYKNGESWCMYDGKVGDGVDAVGSRHFRHVCIAGEETVEACADFRAEVCIQADIESQGVTFTEAACRVNRWLDCVDQDEEDDCLNTDRRDCYWLKGASITGAGTGSLIVGSSSGGGTAIFGGGKTGGFEGGITGSAIAPITGFATSGEGPQLGGAGVCLPNVPKGLKFWTNTDAGSICSIGNSRCEVKFEKGLIGGEKIVENGECLSDAYAQTMNNVCTSLGDCGAYVNIANRFTDDGAELKISGAKQTLGQGIISNARRRAGIK